MSRRSWHGPAGRESRTRRRSIASCCGAIWRTWPQEGIPAGPSPVRPPPFAAISRGFAAMSWSRSTLPGVCRRPQERRACHRVLTPSELKVLLEPSQDGVRADQPASVNARDDALLELLYGSGLRVAELCGLGLGDVDLLNRSVTVWGKGGKQRRVPMSCPATEAIGRYVASGRAALVNESTPAGSLFVNRRGRQMSPTRCAPGARPALTCADPSACAPPHLCDPSRRRRGGLAGRAGAARPREPADD